jgi:hypothetical protein
MCCLAVIAALIGPRLAILIWWLLDMGRWANTFDTFWWPLLGALFLPWTLLAYVLVFPGGVAGLDWLLIILGLLVDLGSYSGGGYQRRRRFGQP